MIKCNHCQFENEDGALFCEQCKSDLGVNVDAGPIPLHETFEPIPLAPIVADAAVDVEPMSVGLPDNPLAVTPTPTAMPAMGAPARLIVVRGVKLNAEYPLYEGENFIGRSDEKPVDIDLEEQESPDRVWSSRQHACIHLENGTLTVEDLNSSNGTFVNRARVHPGEKRQLADNDVIQVGTVHLKLKISS